MKSTLLLLLSVFISVFLTAQSSGGSQIHIIHLKDSVECTEVKDQSQSSTCWVFGTNSLFESDLIKKYNVRLDLSEMYIARFAWIDKAKKYLATNGKTYFAGGGQFHDVIRVVNKYGIVPEEAYTGRVRGEFLHDHTKLDTAMKRYVEGLRKKGRKEFTTWELKQLNNTLDRYLGKIPQTFLYDGKSYTPQTFAKQVMKFENDYIEVMSFADLPMYKKCFLNDKFNWAGDSVYNIPLADMQMLVDTALVKGWSVGWEGDVTEMGFHYNLGYATWPEEIFEYDAERIQNYKDETTERDHMLHLVAAGWDEAGKKWYYMKNSWGDWLGKFKGYLYMSEDYFKLKTVILMVNKEALPKALKIKLQME